ncbi:hypothetical protein [uncultured Lutibacter sp.]|uniref:hypothetical protein n=1 Tax=uncultured Lutibacter sp. TaxID=437739 RepID=UPI00262EAB5E|nr:hypothetical protein [uncultured Lutibacter sp.]
MRNSLIILLALSFTSCKRNNQLNLNQITTNYNNKKLKIERVEYLINRIDSFSNGLIWNNKGYGLIEKDFTDSLFGFSFYGKRFDNQNEVIYYKGNGFIISPKTKSYSIKNNLGIRSRPKL